MAARSRTASGPAAAVSSPSTSAAKSSSSPCSRSSISCRASSASSRRPGTAPPAPAVKSQRVPGRDVGGQLGMRAAAHQHMGAATDQRRQQRRDAGQPGRVQVLIQPVDDQQQMTALGRPVRRRAATAPGTGARSPAAGLPPAGRPAAGPPRPGTASCPHRLPAGTRNSRQHRRPRAAPPYRLGQQRCLPRPRPPRQPPVTLVPVANDAIWLSSCSRPSRCSIRWWSARRNSRTVAQYAGLPRRGGTGSRLSAPMPGTPSRAHHAAGSATPGPQPMGGVGLQRGQRRRRDRRRALPRRVLGHHPQQAPGRDHRAPDIPDHCESPSAICPGGSARGVLLTCTDSNPPASPDSTGTSPIASAVSRTAACREGVPLHERRVADHMTPLHRLTRSCPGPPPPGPSAAATVKRRIVDLHQRQIRARAVHIADEPRIHRRGVLHLVRVAHHALTAPATTCAAVSTVRPATTHPDPYRYRGAPPHPGRR